MRKFLEQFMPKWSEKNHVITQYFTMLYNRHKLL